MLSWFLHQFCVINPPGLQKIQGISSSHPKIESLSASKHSYGDHSESPDWASLSENPVALGLTRRQSFWCVPSMSDFKMLIKPNEFQWLWCVPSMSDFKMLIKPKEFPWFWCVPLMFHGRNPNMKPSQIGDRCSRTRKCSQRHQIDHFC